METKNILLIVIVILVVALIGLAAYIYINDTAPDVNTIAENNTTNASVDVNKPDVINVDDVEKGNDTGNNTTYRVYNPQSDSYVTVVGEGYDDEVDRWYTYDTDGVRYYNTRIN